MTIGVFCTVALGAIALWQHLVARAAWRHVFALRDQQARILAQRRLLGVALEAAENACRRNDVDGLIAAIVAARGVVEIQLPSSNHTVGGP